MFTKDDNKNIKELIEAILLLRNYGEAKIFLRDLLTEYELIEFGNRWKVARMLSQGVSYLEVEKKTGLSSTTVARVSKWLNNGRGGYRFMIKRIQK